MDQVKSHLIRTSVVVHIPDHDEKCSHQAYYKNRKLGLLETTIIMFSPLLLTSHSAIEGKVVNLSSTN